MKRIYDHHVSLFLVSECPNACHFCLASAEPGRKPIMSIDDVGLILSSYDGRWKEVSVGGGEPSLHPKFFDVVKLCRDMGWDVNLHSNDTARAWQAAQLFRDEGNERSITMTFSYNDVVLEKMPGLEDRVCEVGRMVRELGDPRISVNVNVFTNDHNNRLIDCGFCGDQVVKVPVYSLGKSKGKPGTVQINTTGFTGHIYTTDLRKFDIAQYAEACDHQAMIH